MKITHEYFLDEWHKFREIMLSTKYTLEQKQDAFAGLMRVDILCTEGTEEEVETRKTAMGILHVEVPMRLGLEAVSELEHLMKDLT